MKLVRYAAALAALSLALAACGGGSSSTSSGTSAAGGGSGGSGTAVDVKLADFSIDVSGGTTLAAGTYTFNVTNAGPTAHNLTINGPGVDNQATSTFTGGTQKLTVTLSSGTYDFYCSVPGHKQAGMDVNVTVSG